MTKIALVYFSGYGHTKKVADYIAKGINQVEGIELTIYTTDQAIEKLDDLDTMDAIMMGTPTYMGGPAAQFKQFADATSKKWLKLVWKDKLAAGFTNSGSYFEDKSITLAYLHTLASQHGMLWMPLGIGTTHSDEVHHGAPDHALNRLGASNGLMTQSDNGKPPEETPAPGDLDTAALFGERFAKAAKRWVN